MTIVTTAQGQIKGARRANHTVFRGVPFAAPPTGDLRFQAPQPAAPWTGVRDALAFSASAAQGNSATPGMAADGPLSEDCLYLNVFTPNCDTAQRPVLFWIHGGGFTLGNGTSAIYDGAALATRGDVVVVTINYRLGCLGYAQLGELTSRPVCANNGQLDQIAALQWVQENIAQFGGDADNVTIFGESAGGAAVAALLAMPAAQGLFAKAICQSGVAHSLPGTADGTALAQALLGELGLSSDGDDIDRLWQLPWEQLIAAQDQAVRRQTGAGRWAPTLDASTLPLTPSAAIAAGRAAKVPLIIGTNRDEQRLFTRMARPVHEPIDDAQLEHVIARLLPSDQTERAPQIIAAYRRSRAALALPHDNTDLVDAIESDARFRIPSIRLLEAYAAAGQSNVFSYLFEHESPAKRGALGACHALEMPFVFGTLDAPTQDRFCGSGPQVNRISEQMMDAWLAFATSGQPRTSTLPWQHYDAQARRTMVFGPATAQVEQPLELERAAWDGLLGQ